MNIDDIDITAILPQTYPFIMIDRIVEFKKNESLTATKLITGNEWMMEGQSPAHQGIFPETLLIEAAAQAGLAYFRLSTRKENKAYLGKVESEFNRQAMIGDTLILKTSENKIISSGGFVRVNISIEKEQIASVQSFFSMEKDS